MKIEYLELLCDPFTKEPLTLVATTENNGIVKEGLLKSATHSFQITNGIPRFVTNEGYSNNFGYQWNRWARVQFEDENISKPMEGHTKRMFEDITQIRQPFVGRTIILDIGCGSGRFADVCKDLNTTVLCLDYSSAIDAAQENLNSENILFIQGDALNLPIKDAVVDEAYSIGVLHHTPSPQTAVQQAHRVLKKGGRLSIRVYGFGARGFYTYPLVRFWRAVFKKIEPLLGHKPALAYSYFFGTLGYVLASIWRPLSYPMRSLFPTAYEPDLRWSILDTFDAVTTSYQSGHHPNEVAKWFKESGFKKVINHQGNDFSGLK